MEFHEIANIFPMMTGDDYQALRNDIRDNGLIESIIIYEDKILDGRNRYAACLDLGIEFEREEYTGSDPVRFVASKNLIRRHLDISQRAIAAAKIANLNEGRPPETRSIDLVSQEEAAKLFDVSVPSVKRAKQVIDKGIPELIEAVEDGEIAVTKAAEIAQQPEEVQQQEVSKQKNPALYTSNTDEWNTPQNIIDRVLLVLGEIDLDPCSNSRENPNVPALKNYTEDNDGLIPTWVGKVYMNPPYGRVIPEWIDKLVDSYENGEVNEAIALVPSRTDTQWFRQMREYPRCFIWGRLKFSNNETAATFPSMAVYLGSDIGKFIEVFSDIGDVYSIQI